jgi:hypothetical protein
VEAVLDRRANHVQATDFQSGDRVLGKRDEFWYPATMRGKAGSKLKLQFDDGKQVILRRVHVIAFDLQVGDPVYARRNNGTEYFFGNITALADDKLEIRFEDHRKEWTKLANVRVRWEEGDQEED